MPVINVHLAVAPVDFDDGRDQRNHTVADRFDIRALVNREAIDQLHQRGRRAGLRRMNRARDVVNRRRSRHDPVRLRVVHIDRARVRQLREVRAVRVELREVRLGRNGDRDHLAALFGLADREHLHARAGFLDQPHVGVHFVRVGQDVGRAGDVLEDGHRRRHRLRCRQIIDERRREVGRRRIFLDLLRVGLVRRLLRVARIWVRGRHRLRGGDRGGGADERGGERRRCRVLCHEY